ncbi:hypothetical protein DCAR_0832104 [Daucus carota subsp. sativus]|uniref:Factor of DNA methylation 1-5/IDN2 domain-containing protein n=1 Tax=Daucus carota subsp. sativus TaxID=79200 RepID=A0AAF0XR52_DAUCS|nr:hypothetical protein DCAR_0832104 [Daucus carota subsp. sativus]
MLWHAQIKMEHNSERGPQGDGVLGGVVGAGDAGVVAANGGGAAVDSVLRPNNHGEDVEEMKKKMESLEEKLKETEEKLKEKDEDFESLQDSYQALLVKERNNNDQLEDARKKLINVLKDRRTNMRAYTGVKLMGDLNLKPIFAAAKKKYPPAEVELKAMEFSSLLEEKLRDPNWYPFKVITFGEDSKIKMEHNLERGPQGDGVQLRGAGDAGVVAANAGGAAGYIGVMRPNNNGEDIMEMKKKMESLEEKLKKREEKL